MLAQMPKPQTEQELLNAMAAIIMEEKPTSLEKSNQKCRQENSKTDPKPTEIKKIPAAQTTNVNSDIVWPTRRLTSNGHLAIHLLISLITFYFCPWLFTTYASMQTLNAFTKKLHLNSLMASLFSFGCQHLVKSLSNYSPAEFVSTYLPQYVQQYGPIVYLAAPVGALVYHRGGVTLDYCQQKMYEIAKNIIVDERNIGADLIDMMGGFASDEVCERYQDTWAAADVGKMMDKAFQPITNGFNWLWKSRCKFGQLFTATVEPFKKPSENDKKKIGVISNKPLVSL